MYRQLGEAMLKNGARMELGVVECPDASWADAILQLLGHKGPHWAHHLRAAVRGPLDLLETRFYLGTLDGVPVSNVMIIGARGVGLLGHVYTQPEHRRLGACSQLMAAQMEHTAQLGYRALTLGTRFESPAYWIYHRFGFRSIDGVSGCMKWLAAPDEGARWFRPGALHVRPMRWDDWAALNLLAYQVADGDEELPRSWVFELREHGSLEGTFALLRSSLPLDSPPSLDELRRGAEEQGRPVALTMESARGAAVGWAILQSDRLALGDAWLVDFYLHSAYRWAATQLLAAVPWPTGKRVTAYSSAPDGYRAAALRRAGFRQLAELPGWLQPARPLHKAARPLRVFARAAGTGLTS